MQKKKIAAFSIILISLFSTNSFAKNANDYLKEGIKYYEDNKLAQAEKTLRQAIKLNPKLYVAYSKLGNVYLDRGDFKQAIALYNQAIKINPKYASAYYNLGAANTKLGKFDQALNYFKKALSLAPNDSMTKDSIVKVLNLKLSDFANLEDYNDFINIYQELLKYKPQSAAYNAELGLCYARIQNFSEALKYLDKAFVIAPENDTVNLNMGLYLVEKIKNIKDPEKNLEIIQSNLKLAEPYFKKACESGNYMACNNAEVNKIKSKYNVARTKEEIENIENLFKAGNGYYEKKEFEKAELLLGEAYNLDPANKKIGIAYQKALRDHGLELIKKNKKAEGEDLIERALSLGVLLNSEDDLNNKMLLWNMAEAIERKEYNFVIEKLKDFKSEADQEEINKTLLSAYLGKLDTLFETDNLIEAKEIANKAKDLSLKMADVQDEKSQYEKLLVEFAVRRVALGSAYKFYDQKEYKEAETELLKIIEKEPDNAYAYSTLGAVRAKLGKYDESLELIRKAITIKPDNPFDYYYLAHVYLLKKQNLQVIENLKKAITLWPILKDLVKNDDDFLKIKDLKEFKALFEEE
jgi:tetratricopeptide (TPR) repeat protein